MKKGGIKSEGRRAWAKAIVFTAVGALCILALLYAIFSQMVGTVFVQPLGELVGWVSEIDVEDHGGDYRVTLPPSNDTAQ